ncbi:MAG: 16S rRNA (cytosine(1402)-N(4))-methyltransferase RsmH [Calditrichia bacterium]
MGAEYHIPVMLREALAYLITRPDGVYVDCTLGGGGHSEAILQKISGKGRLVGLDADPDAISFARQRLSQFENTAFFQVYYDQLDAVLVQEGKLPVSGFLFDLGISSFQIDKAEKGFAFRMDAPLDMRFDPGIKLSAADVVARYSEEELGRVFREYGEERQWRRLARAVVERRQQQPVQTTAQLADVVAAVVGVHRLNKSLARVFQALRIEVNDELNRLRTALQKAFDCLEQGGRLVVIAYHSLEDRIVKEFFAEKARDCVCPPEFPRCICDKESEVRLLGKRPMFPSDEEVKANPRARSARMRVAEKIIPYRSWF